MNAMQTQIHRAINNRVLPEIQNIMGGVCLCSKMALGRVGPQMSEVSVMFGKTQIQNLQRMTPCTRVI